MHWHEEQYWQVAAGIQRPLFAYKLSTYLYGNDILNSSPQWEYSNESLGPQQLESVSTDFFSVFIFELFIINFSY